MAKLNLLDLAQRSGSDAVVGLVEEVLTQAPEFEVVPARPKKGTTYRVTRRTGLPTVGFRDINAGVTPGKSTYKQEAKPMHFFDAHIVCDEAIVKADDSELGDVLADEASGTMQAMAIALGTQFYKGTSADAKGFAGLNDQVTAGATYYVDAGGSGATAWLVWLDPGYKGVHFVVGNDGEFDLKPWKQQYIPDPNDSSKQLLAWVSNMSFFIGLTVVSQASLFRVKNIDASHPLTDALGAKLVSQVPLARRRNLMWFMSRSTHYLLQNSRSSIGQAAAPYPTAPNELAGYPIVLSDVLVD